MNICTRTFNTDISLELASPPDILYKKWKNSTPNTNPKFLTKKQQIYPNSTLCVADINVIPRVGLVVSFTCTLYLLYISMRTS